MGRIIGCLLQSCARKRNRNGNAFRQRAVAWVVHSGSTEEERHRCAQLWLVATLVWWCPLEQPDIPIPERKAIIVCCLLNLETQPSHSDVRRTVASTHTLLRGDDVAECSKACGVCAGSMNTFSIKYFPSSLLPCN